MELQRFLNVPEARKDHLLKHFSLAYPNTRHIHTQTHASLCLYSGHLGCRKRIGVWPNGRWQLRFEKTHFKMLSPWKEGLCVLVCMSLCEAHSLWTSVNIVNVCMCVCVCELNMTSSLTLSVLISLPGIISYTEYLFLLCILTSESIQLHTFSFHLNSSAPFYHISFTQLLFALLYSYF